MSYKRNRWIEDMPSPWDMDCRGKFCIHEFNFDPDSYEYNDIDGKFKVFTKLKQDLVESGKFDFLANNGIDFYKSAKFTVCQNIHLHQTSIAVLVDMPHDVRTLYKLTFTE